MAGLEWLGKRAYDPATRGFLSTDPLAPVLGAGWDGNPYSYAGNNPLNTTDPTGLRPLSDADLKAYDGS
ncbi:RHS repeat-associated core domain-containing protein, partial [Paenarthrobacter aurescens]